MIWNRRPSEIVLRARLIVRGVIIIFFNVSTVHFRVQNNEFPSKIHYSAVSQRQLQKCIVRKEYLNSDPRTR